MTDLTETFTEILEEAKANSKPPRKSSIIKQWLGINIPQSTCIRMGNYLETLFDTLLQEKSILNELPIRKGNTYYLEYQGEKHQVDLLARVGDQIYTRELKCNTDLDNGKKRDIAYREQAIKAALEHKYQQPINSCIFNPLLINSTTMPGLGYVEGLNEFIHTFGLSLSINEFLDLGRNPDIHRLLLV